jgi:uncharacterized protein YjdB
MLAGCGSGGGAASATGGSVGVVMRWPARTAAAIHSGTESVKITIRTGYSPGGSESPGQMLAERVLNRPKENRTAGPVRVTFSALKPGPIEVQVSAHGLADAAGPAISTGTTFGTVVTGERAQLTVEMNSQVGSVSLDPTEISLLPGQSLTVTGTAHDFNEHELVGVAFHWNTSNPDVVTVNPVDGVHVQVTGVAPGQAEITARDEQGNVVGSTSVFVQSGQSTSP